MKRENPGDYNARITICRRIFDSTDRGGEYDLPPEPLKTLSARVNSLSPSERESAARQNVEIDISFKIRYGKEIDDILLNPKDYLILFNGTYFEIKYPDDFMYRHDRIKLFCSKVEGEVYGE
ncbi:MAG: phage head closure protein [Ruminococcus sp.]|nr:phage head closure protein [Ruminococcus sp.]